eukprot:TRINITY_DN3444_c0_g1_i2.p1 TRINITY_DN3444_c0_g1~~TRINITY_DN3444_c0_g1_i2.p1  ORF type:complete len:333 (+),score=77.72 TRINITY_DN3444_c0_g1_i2:90-1088(+)
MIRRPPRSTLSSSSAASDVYKRQVVRLSYSSLTTPHSVMEFEFSTGKLILLKEQPVPEFDRSLYTSELMHATAADGTSIPMSVVYRTDKRDHSCPAPVFLYGYGSYGICIDPEFNARLLPLLDRGVVYVCAQIRGGGELGRATWYEEQGKYLNKMNTFTDFCDCAQHIVDTGMSTPDKLAICGRSAGGLLMGAVLNLRPDLFKVAVAGVPFVDVLTTMSDASIPLTTGEWEEWGNPNEAKYYEYMKSYSPYDNLTAQEYPSILVTAGLHDPRVAYWEPAKWVARLRDLKTDNNPCLFKCDLSSGHFSASDRYKNLRERAFEYSFLLDQLGCL